MKYLIYILTWFVTQQVLASGLKFMISTDQLSFSQGGYTMVKGEIINDSDQPVFLVYPGDGSESYQRTPKTAYSIIRIEEKEKDHPEQIPPGRYAWCGHINSLKSGSVFILNPGEKEEINVLPLMFEFKNLEPGKYRIVYYYSNDPLMEWTSAQHDEVEMEKVRKSTKCDLISNELIITVTK